MKLLNNYSHTVGCGGGWKEYPRTGEYFYNRPTSYFINSFKTFSFKYTGNNYILSHFNKNVDFNNIYFIWTVQFVVKKKYLEINIYVNAKCRNRTNKEYDMNVFV